MTFGEDILLVSSSQTFEEGLQGFDGFYGKPRRRFDVLVGRLLFVFGKGRLRSYGESIPLGERI